MFITLMDYHLNKEISDTIFPSHLTTSSSWGDVKNAIPRSHGMIERIEFNGVKIVAQDSTPLKDIIDFKKYPTSEMIYMTAYMFTPTTLDFFKDSGFSLEDDDKTDPEYTDNLQNMDHDNNKNNILENENSNFEFQDHNPLNNGSRQQNNGSSHTDWNSIGSVCNDVNNPCQLPTTGESQYFQNEANDEETPDQSEDYYYTFTGENDFGRQVTVKMSSAHCIVVDRHDEMYGPYILLSDTGKKLLSAIAPLERVKIIRDPPKHVTKDESDSPPVQNMNFRQRVRSVGSLIIHGVSKLVTDSLLERIALLCYTICLRTVVLLFFALFFGIDSIPIVPFVIITVLTNKDIARQLEEIVVRDLPTIVQPYMMKLVRFVRLTSDYADRLSTKHVARKLIEKCVNENSMADVHVEDRRFGPRMINSVSLLLKNILKDVILLLVTLIPDGYDVFNEEMTKKEASTERIVQNEHQDDENELGPGLNAIDPEE